MTGRLVLIAFALALTPWLAACQTAMSLEEAKKVTTSFSGRSFVPPPRTINDVLAILEREKRDDPKAVAEARVVADQAPPAKQDARTLADFHYRRGLAAREIGRSGQELSDLRLALQYAERGSSSTDYVDIVGAAAWSEIFAGNTSNAIDYLRRSLTNIPPHRAGAEIWQRAMLVRLHAAAGDFDTAEAEARLAQERFRESQTWQRVPPFNYVIWRAAIADALGRLAQARGRLSEAEAFYRQAIAEVMADFFVARRFGVEVVQITLAGNLARQERLVEAEHEARTALLGTIRKTGRNSTYTALMVMVLARIMAAHGRYADAEALARTAVDIVAKLGVPRDSFILAASREAIASALVGQRRWGKAVAEFQALRRDLGPALEAYQRLAGNVLGNEINPALALLQTGQTEAALAILQSAFQRRARLLGEADPSMAEIRGVQAMAYARRGDARLALREFTEATSVLLAPAMDVDEEEGGRSARDQRLGSILEAYIGLLADIRGTALEREAGIDAAAEAFRLADVARGRSVERALDAGAARAAARTPALADLVRREQDAKKQVSALFGALANAAIKPRDEQDPKVVSALRSEIAALRRARLALAEQIAREFPTYAELLAPKPATVEQTRAALRPGEALVSTLVTPDRTFVWAIPLTGPVVFVAVPVGENELETAVMTLRKALAPEASTVGDIPAFDLAVAQRLYRSILEPVKAGWEAADTLLVAAHGPLAQLPFSLLVTKPATLGPEVGALFSNYQAIPWLARTHAVTVLPSVTSLRTLRALPPGAPTRRPFVGFGDPYFSQEQARRADARSAPSEVAALTPRGVPIALRDLRIESADSARLAVLPRLPDTADEIQGIARVLNADPARDVFLGRQANEKAVKATDLARYRVVAFATHGLAAGDLDGLTQPALALSAPDVAGVEGDGLLTMEEILGLRLNADWVVLSACNTASGRRAGSEAVSGLGRAFFYAGARALLVSHWPVETTSARALTTDLFRRQQTDPRLTRAQALQQTMNWLIDDASYVDPRTARLVYSYAHPIFWAPFALVGDGGASGR